MSYRLITSDDIKRSTKGNFGSDFDYLLDEIITQVGELLAEECNRPDFDKAARTELFSPNENQRALFLKSPPIALPTSIRTAALRWVLSAVGTSVYYVELLAGGNPRLSNPGAVHENGVAMARGSAISALTAGQFAYGNADSLSFPTIYVRLTDSVDPDTKAVGYLEADPFQVWQSTSSPRLYDSTTLLVRDTDYFVNEEEGVIEKGSIGCFYRGMQTVKVAYTGGYATADGQGVPALLRGAALYQAKMMFDRRDELGISSRSLEGGSMNLLPLILPLDVRKELTRFKLAKDV